MTASCEVGSAGSMPIPDLPSTSMSRVLKPGSRVDGVVRNQVGESRLPRAWGSRRASLLDSFMGDLGGAS
jgi:hypothetical protein